MEHIFADIQYVLNFAVKSELNQRMKYCLEQ